MFHLILFPHTDIPFSLCCGTSRRHRLINLLSKYNLLFNTRLQIKRCFYFLLFDVLLLNVSGPYMLWDDTWAFCIHPNAIYQSCSDLPQRERSQPKNVSGDVTLCGFSPVKWTSLRKWTPFVPVRSCVSLYRKLHWKKEWSKTLTISWLLRRRSLQFSHRNLAKHVRKRR